MWNEIAAAQEVPHSLISEPLMNFLDAKAGSFQLVEYNVSKIHLLQGTYTLFYNDAKNRAPTCYDWGRDLSF